MTFEYMKWLKLILVVFLCLGLNAIKAQTWLGKDLSNINVKELTASQREEVLRTAKRQGLNEADLEAMARAKGLNVEDLKRVQAVGSDGKAAFVDTARAKKKVVSENVLQSTVAIYGQELFENNAMGFAPSLNLAPTAAYILGPNDKLSIRIFGLQEQSMNVVIATNGSVVIPYGGKVMLSGLTLSEAERVLTNQLKKYGFASLGSGESHLKIQITDFRTIQVMVWGGKQSGAYYLPSLATAFHALFVAGGPGFNRSYRNIHVIRNGKTLRVIDLYEFLSKGSHSSDITLQDNDIIFIPYYDRRVRLRGEVKTPAVYELMPNENLLSAIQYAGGDGDAGNLNYVLRQDDKYTTSSRNAYNLVTFLGNHDMGRVANLLLKNGAKTDTLLASTLFAHDLMFLNRGTPTVYYGDEIGMIGSGGDKAARQNMFSTQNVEWQREARVTGGPIGTKNGLADMANPILVRIQELNALRVKYPAIATGAQKTVVIAIANPLIAIPSTSGRLVVTMITA